MKVEENNIILCAGPINYLDLPLTTTQSIAMIPVNGRPVIGWILDDLISKGINKATVVMRAGDKGLATFLAAAYSEKILLKLERMETSNSINHSLCAGLAAEPGASTVRVILGDTLIRDPFVGLENFTYTASVESANRWCVVRTDASNVITEYIDKPDASVKNPTVLSGYYHFTDGPWLTQCVEEAIQAGERELSKVLIRFGQRHVLKAKTVKEWFDFGHIDTLVHARNRLLHGRFFNSLQVDSLYHTVTKVSQNNEKLADELNWYLTLPDALKALCPRILRSSKSESGEISFTQEYYGYPTLAELFVFSEFRADTWRSIMKLLLKVHREFCKYKGTLERVNLIDMYVTKTEQRLQALTSGSAIWTTITQHPTIELNGRTLLNLPSLKEFIQRESIAISNNAIATVIHGDFCFSNILFDVNSQIIRLIDPRGSFGLKGVYGDPRYDIAKLRHSIQGLYDFIIADMFKVNASSDLSKFDTHVYSSDVAKQMAETFDELLEQNGYILKEIKFIEALLFLSMIPLHRDKPLRQQMMYLTGIARLNEIYQ